LRSKRRNNIKCFLAAITVDLKFIDILVGWEESAYDSRVLGDAL
jgi:hypothetical protein